MQSLILGPLEKAKITALREKAAFSPIPESEMQERAAAYAEGRQISGFNEYSIELPVGFRLTFTIEQHRPGPMRHMSMSSSRPGSTPHPEMVKMVMSELGYINPLERCIVTEEPTDIGSIAINVIEPLDGNFRPFIKSE